MLALSASAQNKVKSNFGKPTNEELTMTSYAPDPSAAAVVLYAERDVKYDFMGSDFKLFTEVKCRIKVLKEEGKSWANPSVVINYNNGSANRRETITKLKACSYNLEDGKVVKTKMENGMTSPEAIDPYHRLIKFTVPQVKVGSIIEYEYVIVSDYYYTIDEWKAQLSIPVIYTSLRLSIPEYFHFNINSTGAYHCEHTRTNANSTFHFSGTITAASLVEDMFVCRNLPALKKESFIYNVNAYGQKVTCELMSIQIPGQPSHSYATTWEKVDERLMEMDDFGGRLNKSVLKDELAAAGVANLPTTEEKVKAVVNIINSRVRWNQVLSIFGESASKALNDGTGTNATINFMLINMLNEVGVTAFPVVMCTRSQGFLPITNPSVDALTTLIVGYLDGENPHFIDASMLQDGYIDVLPDAMLVDRAHEVNKAGNGEWFNLQALVASRKQSVLAKISTSGELTATCSTRLKGYSAFRLRDSFRQATDSITYVNNLASEHAMEYNEYHLNRHRGFNPDVVETFTCTLQCAATDDRIYFNPLVIPLLTENPFVAETRTMPIDFPSCESQVLTVNITLPENYALEELPQPVNIMSADQGIHFTMQMMVQGNQVVARCTYQLNKLFFTAEEYLDLKAMFAEIVKHNTQMVVAKKIAQ